MTLVITGRLVLGSCERRLCLETSDSSTRGSEFVLSWEDYNSCVWGLDMDGHQGGCGV